MWKNSLKTERKPKVLLYAEGISIEIENSLWNKILFVYS